METTSNQLNYFFNEVRVKQLLGVIKNSRPEYRQAMCGKSFHPVMFDIMRTHSPNDWHRLVLEYPHMAKDGVSVGYYSKSANVNKVVTVCRIGKYIKRHFPEIPDHLIRDYVSPYVATVTIIDDVDDMINAVIHGPHSCMANDDFPVHPYNVYDPKFGWKLAVRMMGEEIVGRALLNNTMFVRCYAKSHTAGGYASADDNMLEAWLEANGYTKDDSWEGLKISKIDYYGKLVAPYIDGYRDNLSDMGSYLVICDDGDYIANNTDGFAENKDNCSCSHCGNRVSDDELTHIGYEAGGVCEYCLSQHYTYIEETRINGRYIGGEYYPNNEVGETVDGDKFPLDDMAELGIVQMHDGEYSKLDDCIEAEGEYYPIDSIGELIVEVDNVYERIENCTKLHDGNYALDADAQLLHNGEYALRDDTQELYNGEYALESDCVELHSTGYALESDCVELHNGEHGLRSDIGTIIVLLEDGEYHLSQLELELELELI